MIIKTLNELLEEKNKYSWVKHKIKLPFKNDIFIEKVDYIEESNPLTCLKGYFYEVDTGINLGKSIKRRIYFILNGVELDYPILIPNIEWREK